MSVVANSLAVTTAIRFASDTLNRYSNMVYLYDPSWVPSALRQDIDALPFVIVNVIKDQIIQTCEVSDKRIILFGRNKESDFTNVLNSKAGTVNVVADNVVNKPVLHKLECLLPKSSLDSVLLKAADDAYIVRSLVSASGGSFTKAIADNLSGLSVGVAAGTALKRVLELVMKFTSSDSDYNKSSLLSMARRRAILVYKPWNSWQQKSVVIKSLTVTKNGNEDDYYRCELELQEMPILYIGSVTSGLNLTLTPATTIANTAGTALKGVFESLMSVRK